MTMKTMKRVIKNNPTAVAVNMMIKVIRCMSGAMLGVHVVRTVGVLSWHPDLVSASTNRSHSKSTAYELSFKKRAGFDRYQFLRAVYNCFVWAALLVLMVPKNTVAPSTSLLQNEWVMVTEEEEMLWHTAPEKEMVYIKMFCSSSSNCDVVCCEKRCGESQQ